MARRRIFISHSNADADSQGYLEVLVRELTADGFDVLVDRKRLVPGQLWRDDIYTWLGLCHAAVVLVSPAAIRPGSIWVPRETSILLWRRALDPKFMVMPVCLGGVTPADLRTGVFADMQLSEIETVPASTPEEMLRVLRDCFRPLGAPKTPLEILASRLTELLRAVSTPAIEDAVDLLAVDLGPVSPTGDPRQALALALLQAPPRASADTLEVLAEYMSPPQFDQLLAMIAPSWVDLCAARWMADCGACIHNKPALVLNAVTPACARMYVDRAACKPPRTSWPVVYSTGVHGESAALEIAAELEQNLIQEFRLADDPAEVNAHGRLAVILGELQRNGRPTFATLKYSGAVAAALPELQRLLPCVTFILLSGDDFPSACSLAGATVRLVEPRLTPGAEQQARLDLDYIRAMIRPELRYV